jgi:hypothetical protein
MMVFWSLKFALAGALVFVALVFALRLVGVLLARITGGTGMDATRPMWVVFYLGIWVISFSIAYSIFPPFARK